MSEAPAPTTLDQLPELVIEAPKSGFFRSRPGEPAEEVEPAPGRYVVKGLEKHVVAKSDLVENEEWFSTPPLTESLLKNLTSVQLFTESHDQGYASDASGGNWTWFELEISESKEDGTRGRRKIPGTHESSWISHVNPFISKAYAWSRGRLFNQDDALLKSCEPGDIISVHACARFPRWENHAKSGYLVLTFGDERFNRDPIDYPSVDGPAPIILACAQEKSEGLMLPISKSSVPDNFDMVRVRGGVELMSRLLGNNDSKWAVHAHPLRSAAITAETLENHTIYELAKAKTKDTLPAVKRYTLQNNKRPDMVVQGGGEIPQKPKIVVVSDAGIRRDSVEVPDYSEAELLIYEMSAPLFQGTLWQQVSQGPKRNGEHGAEELDADEEKAKKAKKARKGRLVVVIDAEDLRAQGMQLSFRLSWEKTMEEFRKYFTQQVHPSDIEGIHLLVRCSYEGVFYVKPGERFSFNFHMVPEMAEGDLLLSRKGLIPGIDTAFLCGLTASLVRVSPSSLQDLDSATFNKAVKSALQWSHRFAAVGFRKDSDGPDGKQGQYNYPDGKDMSVDTMSRMSIIKSIDDDIHSDGDWSIFGILSPFTLQVAANIVKGSQGKITSLVPTAQFGSLLTADRVEIEGFRATAAVVHEYLRGTSPKPLSLAVFGPPGSGKSFGIMQVIKAVTKDQGRGNSQVLEVNLSQFSAYSDLVTTFYTVRDMALGGDTPIVLFDEFDSVFDRQKLGWLKYLLAPMQDAKFLDDGHSRPLGRAIFVFIGGTSSSFDEFNSKNDPDAITAKKPDFASRLSAYIDIRGPNELEAIKASDSAGLVRDTMFPIRRALLLRSILERRLGVSGQDRIDIDKHLLRALLTYPRFKHGARSLDLLVAISRLSGQRQFVPAALPSDNQLRMHVDVSLFKGIMTEDKAPKPDPGEAALIESGTRILEKDSGREVVLDLARGIMARRRKQAEEEARRKQAEEEARGKQL